MKNKNVKVIDEHGIDRKASVVFSVDVDGSDYVVYWIERDTDNDNIFVSKLIKNIDGTSNMMNIEDSMEKGKISDIVKELIKYSIDNESNKLSNKTVTLPSGKVVNMTSVLINNEQNIKLRKIIEREQIRECNSPKFDSDYLIKNKILMFKKLILLQLKKLLLK